MLTGMDEQKPPSDFTRLRRHPERAAYDQATIYAILDAALFCHIGYTRAGRVIVTPTIHWRENNHIYWHGSSASQMLEQIPEMEICLTASVFDGFVLARSGFHHSVNYRSVMCFGRPELVTDRDRKLAALERFIEHFFPGRWQQLRPPTEQEVKATRILVMEINEASAKLRTGDSKDPPEDWHWPVWAGILPLQLAHGKPIADSHLPPGLFPPEGW